MTMTITENKVGTVDMIKVAWTTASSSAGATSGTTTKYYNGKVLALGTNPGAGGLAPTASYDITTSTASSMDILGGGGADRAAAAKEYVQSGSLGAVVGAEGLLTFKVTNAGSSHAGTIYLHIR